MILVGSQYSTEYWGTGIIVTDILADPEFQIRLASAIKGSYSPSFRFHKALIDANSLVLRNFMLRLVYRTAFKMKGKMMRSKIQDSVMQNSYGGGLHVQSLTTDT